MAAIFLMKSKNKTFADLVGNAFDFLEKALDEIKKDPKYSVINFYAAIELFFKARLMTEHWSLILLKPETADISKFKEGDFSSVALAECILRLENIAKERISPDARKSFDEIRLHRNKLMHFYHPKYSGKEKGKLITNIVAEQCRAWLHLRHFIAVEWQKQFRAYKQRVSRLDLKMKSHREFLEIKFKQLKSIIKDLKAKGEKLITCPACVYASARLSEVQDPIFELRCLVCDASTFTARIPCPKCSVDVYCSDASIDMCDSCESDISFDERVEYLIKADTGDTEDAHCCSCDSAGETVRLFGDRLICVSCFEEQDRVYRCEWCDELVSGSDDDEDDSYAFGCGQCEGRIEYERGKED